MSLNITLKPSYEVPLVGAVGAAAQTAFVSGRIIRPFRINGALIVFGDDHINLVRHYFLVGTTPSVSTMNVSEGTNIIPPPAPARYFIGHSMIRKIHVIRDYPEGDFYLKCHVDNPNAYAVTVNAAIIVEEI